MNGNRAKRSTLTILLSSVFVLVLDFVVLADDKKGTKSVSFTITNESATVAAKAFAIGILGIKADDIDQTDTTGKTLSTLALVRQDTNGVTLRFENATNGIPKNGGQDTITIVFKSGKGPETLRFAPNATLRADTGVNGKVIDPDVTTSGVAVKRDPDYTFLNASGHSIVLHDLQFWLNAPLLRTDSLLDFNNPFGFGSTLPDAPVSAFGSFEIPVPGTVADGNWLYARGRIIVDGVEVSDFAQGDTQFVVPEPASLVLLVSGLLSLAACAHLRLGRAPHACYPD
jgi:hypothetical protein